MTEIWNQVIVFTMCGISFAMGCFLACKHLQKLINACGLMLAAQDAEIDKLKAELAQQKTYRDNLRRTS